jgi:hypothetical protein
LSQGIKNGLGATSRRQASIVATLNLAANIPCV